MSKSKLDRLRGHRTNGKGNTKNKRGAGCKGGRGRAGSHKHKFSKYYMTFGIKKRLNPKTKLKTITLEDLKLLAKDKKEINLSDFGFQKILGKGNITTPLIIKNAVLTKVAKEKIEKAGGRIE